MRLVFVVDARSSISRNWISHLVELGHDVHVISTYPCSTDVISGATIYQVPIAFSGFSRVGHNGMSASEQQASPRTEALASLRVGALSNFSLTLRSWLSPIELFRHVKRARELISQIGPDLVHAMRIPFEAILAAKATPVEIPFLVSVWGNDFTLFSDRNPLIARQTLQTLERADALHCDCQRDLNLATGTWGFQPRKPAIVLPGAGGVPLAVFHLKDSEAALRVQLEIPHNAPVICNPRGFRNYVRNDIFFRAIPTVLKECGDAIFMCCGMRSNPIAEKWVSRLGIKDNVRLLPVVEHEKMADLFRLALVSVSPSLHDGTPNSLLEAMACGCFPVAGDIESVREWITDGENGLLCDSTSQQSLSRAIVRSLQDRELRDRARVYNLELIVERADSNKVMMEAERFYHQVIQRAHSSVPV